MSVLPPDVHSDLTQLLEALQSSDNNVRSQAEEHLANNWQATKPEMLLMGLVEQLQGASEATVISLYTDEVLDGAVLHADLLSRHAPLLPSSSAELPPNPARCPAVKIWNSSSPCLSSKPTLSDRSC